MLLCYTFKWTFIKETDSVSDYQWVLSPMINYTNEEEEEEELGGCDECIGNGFDWLYWCLSWGSQVMRVYWSGHRSLVTVHIEQKRSITRRGKILIFITLEPRIMCWLFQNLFFLMQHSNKSNLKYFKLYLLASLEQPFFYKFPLNSKRLIRWNIRTSCISIWANTIFEDSNISFET